MCPIAHGDFCAISPPPGNGKIQQATVIPCVPINSLGDLYPCVKSQSKEHCHQSNNHQTESGTPYPCTPVVLLVIFQFNTQCIFVRIRANTNTCQKSIQLRLSLLVPSNSIYRHHCNCSDGSGHELTQSSDLLKSVKLRIS